MQSRKSSILKPKKAREPLQDLNQLLPNNDDDETTTTDAQRRRVSFASMNKVKEYETVPECVAVINTSLAYDKHYCLSTDSYQHPIPGKNANETYQTTTVSRKSIQNTLKVSAARPSIADENIYVEEDVELTETIGRIYDIPMKSSGDSSMEMTHVISQPEIQFDGQSEDSEVLGPLNLTKENPNQTGSFADAHIVEIEIVKNEKDADTSSMEMTEVISNNVIRTETPTSIAPSMEMAEVISNVIRSEKLESSTCSMEITETISPNYYKNGDDSSMEVTDVICDNLMSESLKSQSAFFETIQSSQAFDDTNRDQDVEYISVRNFESPSALPKRKSIFEMSSRPLTNWDQIAHRDNSNYSLKMDSSKLVVCNESLSLTCQGMANRIDDTFTSAQVLSEEVEQRLNITSGPAGRIPEVTFNAGNIQTSTQDTNKTKYDAVSMQLMSQEVEKRQSIRVSSVLSAAEKTKYNNSNMELLTQEDNKTKCNNSNMELLTQEEDKTKYNSNIELLSQEENKTRFSNSNMELVSQEDNKTKYNNSNMELLTQEKTKCHESAVESPMLREARKLDNSVRAHIAEDSYGPFYCQSLHDETAPAEKSGATLKLDEIATPVKPDLSECSTGFLSLPVPPQVEEFTEAESASELVKDALKVDPNTQPTSAVELNDKPHETSLKSSQEENSSANDSNSPLTVGVNFSIFQKNKETRVEFSGTIDSNKKKKSISNVKVNIINNKTEKSNKHVKELRFSMPATSKIKRESEIQKPEFSATFTDFSIPNEGTSPAPDETAAIEENKAEKVDVECAEAAGPLALNLSPVPGDDSSHVVSAKPAKKRLSNDAFEEVDESQLCPKRRSLCHEANDSQRMTVSPADTESSGSSASLVRRSVTEITQRRESFVREEKSIVAIDDVLVETCARSTNISYETRQLVSVAESCAQQNGSTVEPTCGDTKATVDSEAANASNEEFSDAESHSLNQSSSQETNDYSLHNPSIIVNVGDSFSHYKSMDLGTDNISADDIRGLVDEEPKAVADCVEPDDMSKENFVVEWLQNKTGKTNVDARLFSSLADSSSLSTVKSVARGSVATVGDTIRVASREGSQKVADQVETEDPVFSDEGTPEKRQKMSPEYESNAEMEPIGRSMPEVDAESGATVGHTVCEVSTEATSEKRQKMSPEYEGNTQPEVGRSMPDVEAEGEATVGDTVRRASTEATPERCLEVTTDLVESNVDSVCVSDEVIPEKRLEMSFDYESNRMETEEVFERCTMQKVEADTSTATVSETIRRTSTEGSPKRCSTDLVADVEPDFVSDEPTSEKRQKMSPEYESNRMETEQIEREEAEAEPVVESTVPVMKSEVVVVDEPSRKQSQQAMRPHNVFSGVKEDHGENKAKKSERNQHSQRKFAMTKKDILEKIEALKTHDDNQKWKFQVASEDEWVFQFFFDQLELCIKFDRDENSSTCTAVCQYVQPSHIKYYEISKIAVEYLIRKNESKLKKICQTVEDVPYLLKLIEPDVTYIENFVADVLRLSESEIFKIKNGRAVFYVYSFKNILSVKIQINISRLERLSIKDIQVEEIVGKADLNLIRSTFSEAGRDSDFISKFVKKLWIVLDE